MAYYSSPEEMFAKRAESAKKSGDRHWAMAIAGNGKFHYGKAKTCYKQAAANQTNAEKARSTGTSWSKTK